MTMDTSASDAPNVPSATLQVHDVYAHNVGNVTVSPRGATAPLASVQVGLVMIYVHGSDEYDALLKIEELGEEIARAAARAVRLAAKVEVVATTRTLRPDNLHLLTGPLPQRRQTHVCVMEVVVPRRRWSDHPPVQAESSARSSAHGTMCCPTISARAAPVHPRLLVPPAPLSRNGGRGWCSTGWCESRSRRGSGSPG